MSQTPYWSHRGSSQLGPAHKLQLCVTEHGRWSWTHARQPAEVIGNPFSFPLQEGNFASVEHAVLPLPRARNERVAGKTISAGRRTEWDGMRVRMSFLDGAVTATVPPSPGAAAEPE